MWLIYVCILKVLQIYTLIYLTLIIEKKIINSNFQLLNKNYDIEISK